MPRDATDPRSNARFFNFVTGELFDFSAALANAWRRGTAGPARDAIGARRAAGVGTARPRRRRDPVPRDRRTTGSASTSRRFAPLT